MKFKVGNFRASIDRYGFITIGMAGMYYESATAGVREAIHKEIDANPFHPDTPSIRAVITRARKNANQAGK